MIGGSDRGHDVSAKGGTGLQQIPGFFIDCEAGTVRGEPAVCFYRYPGNKSATAGCCPADNYLGLVLLDHPNQYSRFILIDKLFQSRIVYHQHHIGPMLDKGVALI